MLADTKSEASVARPATECQHASVIDRAPCRKGSANQRLLGFTITTVVAIGCVALGEIGLWTFSPIADPYIGYKNQKQGILNQFIRSEFPAKVRVTTEVGDDLPGMSGRHIFSTNNMGFRGDNLAIPKPADEFRVFLIGGSTTECFYLDDSQTISAVLQQYLGEHVAPPRSVRVYNAGKSGDATDDHVSMLVHRIVHLEPDMVIVFSGINDLTRSIYNYDYLHYVEARAERSTRSFLRSLSTDFFALTTEFQIPRRLYHLRSRLFPTDQSILLDIPLRANYQSKVELKKSVPVSSEQPRVDRPSYANNLATIIGVAKTNKIQLVFVTQQTTWNSSVDPQAKKWHWMLYRNGKTYQEALMDEALESLNDVMRALAKEHSIPLYDLARVLPKSTEYFYDDVHFNVKGASVMAVGLGQHVTHSLDKH